MEHATVEVSLEGKVALVTGVGPNIRQRRGAGAGQVRRQGRVQRRVQGVDRRRYGPDREERRRGDGRPRRRHRRGHRHRLHANDVLAAWGRIDILVNDAALLGGRGVLDETAEAFQRAVIVSAMGTFLNTKYVGRAMAERDIKGSIVCVSSSNGWSGTAGVCAYAFHKGGVNNFVRAAAMDLAPYGIRVNSYTPTAPNPDNPELLAERAAQGFGPGGVLSGPPGGGLGGPTGDEEWRRPTRYAGPRGADGPDRQAPARRPTSATRSPGSAPTTPG